MKRIVFLLFSTLLALSATAQTLPTAPYFPAQAHTASRNAPITVQYPHEGMQTSRGAEKILFLGQINLPAPVTLDVNGQNIPLYKNGAFLAFVPVQSGDFELVLTAVSQGKTYQAVRRVYVPGRAIKDFSAKAAFDDEEIFPTDAVEILPGDTLDLYVRGTPHAQVTARIKDFKGGPKIPLTEDPNSPGMYRATFRVDPTEKPLTATVTYRMKKGPKNSSAKITAPEKIKVLSPQEALRPARIRHRGTKLRKIPTPRGNLYPFYRAYGTVLVNGQMNGQYRLSLNENETAWLETGYLQLQEEEPFTPNRLTELTLTPLPEKTRLVFSGLREVPISIHEFKNRIEVSFYYTDKFEEVFAKETESPLVGRIEWSQPQPDTVAFRIHFKPGTKIWGHAYDFEDGNFVLDLVHQPQLTPQPGKPLTGARILLDAGHSPKRSAPYDGAVGPTGYLEYEATLALANDLKPRLEAQGATVLLTRREKNQMSLQQRYKAALQKNAHIFVSLHYNALPDTTDPFEKERGYSVYYTYPHSLPLARAVHRAFSKHVALPDSGLIENDVLFIPRISQLPSILVENAFLIVPEQEEMAQTLEGRRHFVDALYEGILKFYGITPSPSDYPQRLFQKPQRRWGKKTSSSQTARPKTKRTHPQGKKSPKKR